MECQILVTGIFLLCITAVTSVDPTRTPSTTIIPSTTTPSWQNTRRCYVCTSSDYEQDYCSPGYFDPFDGHVDTSSGCMTCQKVVTVKDGKVWTSRSCVLHGGGNYCSSDEETLCCKEDYCNGMDRPIRASHGMRHAGSLVAVILVLGALML